MKSSQLKALVNRHKERYRTEEKALFETNTRFYNGQFFDKQADRLSRSRYGSQNGVPLAAVNLFFMLAESLSSSLLGRDISVMAKGRDEHSEKYEFMVSRLLAQEFSRNKFRSTMQVSLLDATLARRGCLKVIPDKANKGARILEVHPRYLGYSPDARVLDDSSYFIQCVPLAWRAFKQNVESGEYLRPAKGAKPEGLPEWAVTQEEQKYRDIFGHATMWEIYDAFDGKVYHYYERGEQVLYEGKPTDHPFGMFSLNHNGRNLDGLSEVELIFDQQLAINDFRSTMMQLAYTLVPRMMYDAGIIDEEQLAQALHSPTGSYVPVKRKGHINNRQIDFKSIFSEVPQARIAPDMINAMDMAMGDAQLVSSLMPQNRGVATNVRTAAEMAFIEATEKSRIAGRMANMEINGIVPVAERVLHYIKKYRQGPHKVRMGRNDWQSMTGQDLLDFDGSFELAATSPIKLNPAAIAESLGAMANIIVNDPNINMREVLSVMFEGWGIPKERVMLSEEEVKQVQQQMMAQEQQGALPQPSADAMVAASEQAALEDPEGGLPTADQTAQVAQGMM